MLSAYDIKAVIAESLEAGAAGYLLKDASPELLCQTLKATRHGAAVLSRPLLKEALAEVQRHHLSGARDSSLAALSRREGHVLEYLMEGMPNRGIADKLGITEHTVKKHVQRILHKMHASDRTQAAVRAVQHGFPAAGVPSV
jgi:DNA-binding NarL/FixJ family response regulator